MTKIRALLIAAGTSHRMGSPKQLLRWGTKTLIEHQIKILQDATLEVSVILGFKADKIQKAIAHYNVQVYINENWELGMGTSIACGVKKLNISKATVDGILIALVNQPLISAAHFRSMVERFEPGENQIIVSRSDAGITRPPVLFDASYINELMTLQGDEGAKPVIKKHKERVILMSSESVLDDMDTPEAYQKLLKLANLQS